MTCLKYNHLILYWTALIKFKLDEHYWLVSHQILKVGSEWGFAKQN